MCRVVMEAEGVLPRLQAHFHPMQNCEEAEVCCDDDARMAVTGSPIPLTAKRGKFRSSPFHVVARQVAAEILGAGSGDGFRLLPRGPGHAMKHGRACQVQAGLQGLRANADDGWRNPFPRGRD